MKLVRSEPPRVHLLYYIGRAMNSPLAITPPDLVWDIVHVTVAPYLMRESSESEFGVTIITSPTVTTSSPPSTEIEGVFMNPLLPAPEAT